MSAMSGPDRAPVAPARGGDPVTADTPQPGSYRLTAVLSGLLVLLLVVGLAFVPVPFVSWSPGRTVNVLGDTDQGRPMIAVSGLSTRSSNAQLRMTTVSVTTADGRLSLVEALASHLLPHRDVLQRDAVYPTGKSAEDVRADEVAMMDTSQRDAVVAALRAAGQPVTEMPMISAVTVSGPAYNVLVPGDLVQKVDGTAVQSVADVQRAIRKRSVGDTISISVLRDGSTVTRNVVAASSRNDPRTPLVGITLSTGYRYAPTVSFGVPGSITGPSAGLVLSLGVYQTISSADLLGDLKVAGTGEISPDGTVGAIGGINEKIAGAQRDGAKIFLVPADNCRDVRSAPGSMTLVKVATLKDAISALQKVRSGADTKEIPHCDPS
jgi:PDZ domain-containing protein